MNRAYKLILLLFLLAALLGLSKNTVSPNLKNSIDAADYGVIPGCLDAGAALNAAFAAADEYSVIAVPPGHYDPGKGD